MKISTGAILSAGLLAVAVGCAGSGKPVTQAQFAETEATIRSAESAGAFERASDLLQKARRALGDAQQASGKGDHVVAQERLLETTTYAEAARTRALVEQQKSESAAVRQQADEIEAKAEVMRRQLQVP